MASKRRSLGERLATWNALSANLRQDLADLPQLEKDVDLLDQLAAEGMALTSELQVLRGRVRVATIRLRSVGRQGDMLRSRIGATLRGALGFEAGELLKYGFRPRTRRIVELPEDPAGGPGAAGTEIPAAAETGPAAAPEGGARQA